MEDVLIKPAIGTSLGGVRNTQGDKKQKQKPENHNTKKPPIIQKNLRKLENKKHDLVLKKPHVLMAGGKKIIKSERNYAKIGLLLRC